MRPLCLALLCLCGVFAGCSDEMKKENAALTRRVSELEIAKAQAEGKVVGLREQLDGAKKRTEQLTAEVGAAGAELERARAEASKTAQGLEVARGRIQGLEQERDRLQHDLAGARAQLSEAAANRKGQITGAVSYYFNDNYGYKPDTGAEVFIVPAPADNAAGELFVRFEKARQMMAYKQSIEALQRSLAADGDDPPPAQTKAIRDLSEQMAALGVRSSEDLAKLSGSAHDAFVEATKAKTTIHATADGSGAYRHSVAPGKYWVFIRSKHRDDMTSIYDFLGKMHYSAVEVSADDEVDVSAKFEVD